MLVHILEFVGGTVALTGLLAWVWRAWEKANSWP